MENKKRIVCFYRVSTKQQIIDDDIPVQRNSCLEFINRQKNWEFVGEYIEKGVSGFKIHANEREKLEELKGDALAHKFDAVLVFLFDRLGRIEEETPFVLKWFVDNGIEMWSVNEGQRKFDNHVDNLLNYITFWQASGESKKTQLRTLEAKRQMVEEGRFQGCAAPYGYKHIPTGRHNAKGREIKELIVNEDEAKIVKRIYYLMTQKGYGSRRISKLLNEESVPTKRGGKWAEQTVISILKNSINKGYFTYGRKKAENGVKRLYKNQYDCQISTIKHEELAIVSEEQWEVVRRIIESRASKTPQSHVPKQTKSPLLFTGYIYCGECGSRMTLKYSYNHHKRKDGTYNRDKKTFYQCYGKSNGITSCNNKNYASNRINGIVLKYVFEYLDELEQSNITKDILKSQEKSIKECYKSLKQLNEKIKKVEEDITLLKNEILNVLRGTSNFSQEILTEQIDLKTKELISLNNETKKYISKIEEIERENDSNEKLKKLIPKYREILSGSDTETKKMVLPNFIDKIIVGKEEIDVKLNIKTEELIKHLSA